MKKIYLGSPYTGYNGSRGEAFQLVCQMAAEIMKVHPDITVFCPIAHSHAIETEGDMAPQEGNWWLARDFPFLKACDELWIYKMDGWEKSYGVGQEIQIAKSAGMPIKYLEFEPQLHVGKYSVRT